MRGDLEHANEILLSIPKAQYNRFVITCLFQNINCFFCMLLFFSNLSLLLGPFSVSWKTVYMLN